MNKYHNFNKALANLHEGAKLNEPYSIVEQAGIVALFEICFEQSWKLIKSILESHGRFDQRIGSPRSIIKIAYQCGMIQDEEQWLELIDSRNIIAHTYSEQEALNIIKSIKKKYILYLTISKRKSMKIG